MPAAIAGQGQGPSPTLSSGRRANPHPARPMAAEETARPIWNEPERVPMAWVSQPQPRAAMAQPQGSSMPRRLAHHAPRRATPGNRGISSAVSGGQGLLANIGGRLSPRPAAALGRGARAPGVPRPLLRE